MKFHLASPTLPEWIAYLKRRQPKSLILWGKNDPAFSAMAPKIIKQALPAAELRYFAGGHFVLDEYAGEVADAIIGTDRFLASGTQGRTEVHPCSSSLVS